MQPLIQNGDRVILSLENELCIPPNSTVTFPLNDIGNCISGTLTLIPLDITASLKYVSLEPTICSDVPIGFAHNTNPFNVYIPANMGLYTIENTQTNPDQINHLFPVENLDEEECQHRLFVENRRCEYDLENFKPNISFGEQISCHPERVKQISELLLNKKEAFSTGKYDIGRIKNYRYGVVLEDNVTWYQSPRRTPPNLREEMRDTFKNEKERGLLSQGNSCFNVPLVVVRKPNGKFRICMDLRKANKSIIVSKYPLPDLNSLLYEIGENITNGSKDEELFIVKLDLNSAFR